MRLRVCWMAVALAVAPAWGQETPAPSFDLHSAAIGRIVRQAAATQFGDPSLAEPPPKDPQAADPVKWVPPEKASPKPSPLPRPTRPQPDHQGPISALVDTLIESALGFDQIDLSDTEWDDWLRCPQRAERLPRYLRDEACPGHQSAWGLTEPLGYVAPELRR
jgi:hypothetical protein